MKHKFDSLEEEPPNWGATRHNQFKHCHLLANEREIESHLTCQGVALV